MDTGAGEKPIRLEVDKVVFGVAIIDDGADDAKANPEVVSAGAEVAVVVEGKLYAGGASTFETAAGVLPKEKPKPLAGCSAGFDSTGVVGFVDVSKEKVALLSDLVGVPKLNPPEVIFGGSLVLTTSTGFGGIIFPKPGSLMGSLIKAAIPLGLGTTSSTFFSSTFGDAASTVSLTTIGAFFGASSSSSSSKSSLKQLRIIDSFDFSTCFKVTLLQLKIGDLSFGLMKLIRPPSSSSSSCSSLSLTTGLTTVSSYFLLNIVIFGCVGFGLIDGIISGTLLTICGNGADSILLTFTGSRFSTLPSVATVAFNPTVVGMGVEKL